MARSHPLLDLDLDIGFQSFVGHGQLFVLHHETCIIALRPQNAARAVGGRVSV